MVLPAPAEAGSASAGALVLLDLALGQADRGRPHVVPRVEPGNGKK